MDMSVPINQTGGQPREPEAAKTPARGANSSDLDTWLEKVEALGELKRITAEVDPDLEAATITYLVGSEKSPGAAVREHQGASRPQGALQHDRLQPVALLPDDRRAAGRSSAQGGADPAEEARPQDAAEGSAGRERDLQPERRRGRRDRHPHVPGAAHVAARRRHVSRHRRRGGDEMPGDRPHQRRHLPHDDQGAARGRRLHLARQGRHHRPREVVEAGQADADRRRLRHRSAAVPGGGDQPAEDRERVRILFRHQRRADRTVHRPTSPGCRCRRAPRSSSKASSIRTRPSPRGRSASSPATTAGRRARRRTCGSSACAIATTRR